MEVDVKLGNVGVEFFLCGRGKIKSREVQTITDSIGVRVRIGLEYLQHSGISSGTEGTCSVGPATWIKAGELLRAQCDNLCRIRAVGCLSSAASQVRDHALSQVVAGHDAKRL